MTRRRSDGLLTFDVIGTELGITAREAENDYKRAIYKLKKNPVMARLAEIAEAKERVYIEDDGEVGGQL